MDSRLPTTVDLPPTPDPASDVEEEKVDDEEEEIWRPPSFPTVPDGEDGCGSGDDQSVDDITDPCGYERREIRIVSPLDSDVINCDATDDDVITANNENDDSHDVDSGNEYKTILPRPTSWLKAFFDEAPEFLERLKAYNEARVGDAVTFVAKFRAIPTPTVKWYKDEEEVRPTLRHHLDYSSSVSSNEGTIRLAIDDVRTTDEGAYKVKVENQEGVASTTGYLSVTEGKNQRSKKLSRSSNISTPPFLRPIAEQKSMEESEALELSRQPPSPLQTFIDSIRRSAKSKHPPIYYGTSSDVFAAIDGDDGNPENSGSVEEDDDVFDVAVTPTSSESPFELLLSSSTDDEVACLDHASSGSGSDSENHEAKSPNSMEVFGISDDTSYTSESPSADAEHTSTWSRRRLGKLQPHHRLAIDVPDLCAALSSSEQFNHHPQDMSQPTYTAEESFTPRSDNAPAISTSAVEQSCHRISGAVAENFAKETTVLSDCFKSAQEISLQALDSRTTQFYMLFVALSAALANTFDLEPFWLVIAVAILSFVSFLFVGQTSSRRRSSLSPLT